MSSNIPVNKFIQQIVAIKLKARLINGLYYLKIWNHKSTSKVNPNNKQIKINIDE